MRIGGFPSKMGIQHHTDNEVIDVKIFMYPRHIGRCPILDGGFSSNDHVYIAMYVWRSSTSDMSG